MKTILIVLSAISILMLLSTLICGFWIKAQGAAVDKSSLSFHAGFAVIAILITGTTLVLALIKAFQAAA